MPTKQQLEHENQELRERLARLHERLTPPPTAAFVKVHYAEPVSAVNAEACERMGVPTTHTRKLKLTKPLDPEGGRIVLKPPEPPSTDLLEDGLARVSKVEVETAAGYAIGILALDDRPLQQYFHENFKCGYALVYKRYRPVDTIVERKS